MEDKQWIIGDLIFDERIYGTVKEGLYEVWKREKIKKSMDIIIIIS